MESDLERRQRFQSIFDLVYEPLQRYFGRRSRAEDVSDLLNDVLLVIWRRLEDAPTDDPLPWSYGVARRCLANARRGDSRRLRLVGRVVAQPRTLEPSAATMLDHGGHRGLSVALDSLDDNEREVIRLWAWEQLEPREIALVLGTTPNAVSLRLSRAKKKIAASLKRQNDPDAGQERIGHGREDRS